MHSARRTIINLEMLSEEMHDDLMAVHKEAVVSTDYLNLLHAYQMKLAVLEEEVSAVTDMQLSHMLNGSVLAKTIINKRMLSVQIRLLNYVSEYYLATQKADAILNEDFAEQADQRLNILQSRAIKMRKQLKTVAEAMGREDYSNFVVNTPLPSTDWSWQRLFWSLPAFLYELSQVSLAIMLEIVGMK